MHFELIDEYLFTGSPPKAQVVATLLAERSPLAAAAPFYEGMRMLGARTPDLTLVALRLVLAGKRADDAGVIALRDAAAKVRAGGGEAGAAKKSYMELLAAVVLLFLVAQALPAGAQTATPSPNLYRSLESGKAAHRAAEIRGQIESIDYPANTFIVRDARGGTKIVAVVPNTAIYRHGGYATFADLRRGQHADISVYEVGGHLVAQTIRI
ncbi:MAG TPA: hypothetical protein VMA98_12080 [Candidatus Acidoferrales bacterium]|nr:hypothetical protein [Candidatus Acidoferrales bacterium]